MQPHSRVSRWGSHSSSHQIHQNDPQYIGSSLEDFYQRRIEHDLLPVVALLSIDTFRQRYGFSYTYEPQEKEGVDKLGFIATLDDGGNERKGFVFLAFNTNTHVVFHCMFQEKLGKVILPSEIEECFAAITSPAEEETDTWQPVGKYCFEVREEAVFLKISTRRVFIHPIR